ncbi:MAG: cryptochrome/photolyase family protein [Acidithiobacillus sp.]|uniref:cryptochrome/photolyase family protein n=1 Tax=Acidithiobacillus sp. TaxID=1872118 RepID=UPI003D06BBAB
MPHPTALTLVLFRNDLRLADHPALWHAAQKGPILPVYLHSAADQSGLAWRWWQGNSLLTLKARLAERGLPLVLRSGQAREILPEIVRRTGAAAVYWNRRYDSEGMREDEELKRLLKTMGIEVRSFVGNLLVEPWEHLREGRPYRVFTPFWKAMLARHQFARPLPEPTPCTAPADTPESEDLADWGWQPRHPDWSLSLAAHWRVGEAAAWERLHAFVDEGLTHYAEGRNLPGKPYVSRLSPYLAHGEVSPRQIWWHFSDLAQEQPGSHRHIEAFLRELGWREFSWHLLYHFPDLPREPLRPEFGQFPWRDDPAALRAWQRGRTGYPIVDAGMRELWQSGWMHNRVRMIVASFLVKDLRVPWQEGEAWFWDTLVDADLANNSASWQWVAGCGADAAPYFRVFNPVLQAEKFDPDGEYIRKWLPPLRQLPTAHIHAPWEAPAPVLEKAGVTLGKDYPRPLVDHHQAREAALAAWETIRQQTEGG